MEAGIKGTLLTAKVLAAEVPQVLVAVTVIFPLVKLVLLMAVAMVVVVEVPVIPAGSAQLYRVAPVEVAHV
jgi:hypothetical protein